jgi:hypothetical protein
MVVFFLFGVEGGYENAATRLAGAGALAFAQLLGQTAADVFYTVVVTVAYRDLVSGMDGVGGQRLVAVFD